MQVYSAIEVESNAGNLKEINMSAYTEWADPVTPKDESLASDAIHELSDACRQMLEITGGSSFWNGETQRVLRLMENILGHEVTRPSLKRGDMRKEIDELIERAQLAQKVDCYLTYITDEKDRAGMIKRRAEANVLLERQKEKVLSAFAD